MFQTAESQASESRREALDKSTQLAQAPVGLFWRFRQLDTRYFSESFHLEANNSHLMSDLGRRHHLKPNSGWDHPFLRFPRTHVKVESVLYCRICNIE
jgi:hypothetical protein